MRIFCAIKWWYASKTPEESLINYNKYVKIGSGKNKAIKLI